MKKRNWIQLLDKVVNGFEISIALLLLAVIAIKMFDNIMFVTGQSLILLNIEFDRVLSMAFSLVIGVEFVRMLCKHTADTVVDVLLFVTSRHIILYNEGMIEMLIGIAVIAGLFGIKKYLIGKKRQSESDCLCGSNE